MIVVDQDAYKICVDCYEECKVKCRKYVKREGHLPPTESKP